MRCHGLPWLAQTFKPSDLSVCLAGFENATGSVLCPVCQRANLVELHGILACPIEGWQMDRRIQGCNLDHVRNQLARFYEVCP